MITTKEDLSPKFGGIMTSVDLGPQYDVMEKRLVTRGWQLMKVQNGWHKWMPRNRRTVLWYNDGKSIITGETDPWLNKVMPRQGMIKKSNKSIHKSVGGHTTLRADMGSRYFR